MDPLEFRRVFVCVCVFVYVLICVYVFVGVVLHTSICIYNYVSLVYLRDLDGHRSTFEFEAIEVHELIEHSIARHGNIIRASHRNESKA